MTWITLPSVSVQNGSKIVTVNNTQTTNIKVGDALLIGNYQPVEIAGVFATQLSLRTNWSNAAQANASAVVLPTFGDFNAATQALRQATQVTQGNFKTLEDWGTKLGNITFEGQDNSKHTARTLLQMDADVSELEEQANNLIVSLSGLNFALSKAIVDVIRGVNNEQYVASGVVHFGRARGGSSGGVPRLSVNEGLWSSTGGGTDANTLSLGQADASGSQDASTGANSKTHYPVFNCAGFIVSLRGIGSTVDLNIIKFPEAPNGTVTYNKTTGAVTKHADAATAFALATGDVEVVTERVDLFGIEGYLEKANGTLYPYGIPQGQLTTVDGVATEVDNSRPITYFAAYDGDTSSRGRRWDLSKLTFVQLATILSNPDHNAYYTKEGELVQFRVRQRTIAGAGNGDWANINPDLSGGGGLQFRSNNPVIPQGMSNTPSGTQFVESSSGAAQNKLVGLGAFVQRNNTTTAAVNGECYFMVMGTVPRLNQGAFHPSFNPMGTRKFQHTSGDASVMWYSGDAPSGLTKADCFRDATSNDGSAGKGYRNNTGYIGGSGSGRPDDRFYDALYASGQGGVIDYRLSAWDMSSKEEASKIFQKVVNGTYRGLEKLVKTTPYGSEEGAAYQGLIQGMYKWNATGPDFVISQGTLGVEGADAPLLGWLVQEGKLFPVTYMFQTSGSDTTQIYCGKNTWERYAEGKIVTNIVSDKPLYFMHIAETNLSVSGDFTQLDVIGSPAEILKVDALKNGWMGGWRLSGVSNRAGLTRKALSSYNARITTENSGATWMLYSHALDTAINSVYTAVTPTNTTVEVHPYTVFAKQTKPGTNKSVLNSSEGVGDVYAMDRYTTFNGASFVESLIGKVPISSSTRTYAELMLQEATKTNESKLAFVSHSPLVLDAPTNNSPAVKALWHQASNNRQATLNFLWNELVFDAAWRTPDKVWSGGSVAVAAGETFRAESSSAYAVAGLLMRCVKAVTANATVLGAMHVTRTGEVISTTDGLTYFKVVTDGWSDDAIIRIIDGVGTFNNENGDTCLYGISELAMPYGYTKNQAGAGKQVVGVDL
ncbi:hypothetical protein KZY44_001933 [Vibrio vulnificus]|nr:hypothetical protein [Vibrio vulnificus]